MSGSRWKILVAVAAISVGASTCEQESSVSVPTTVSKEWQEFLRALPPHSTNVNIRYPGPNDVEAWEKLDQSEKSNKEFNDRLARLYQPQMTSRTLGGVPVLDVKPKNWDKSATILVYVHGGGYTSGSAHSKLGNAVAVAEFTRLRVISIDYTVAPRAKWQRMTDEVVEVLKALQQEGTPVNNLAILGGSAGGGLAAGAVLKMRDRGLGMPAAVVLWSPWADITETGDTYETLKAADPVLVFGSGLKASADAYADPTDQKHPYVSPVYGDYTKGFPPTLIQCGTKEIFLSNCVRQYQAIDSTGLTVKLDLYEGMIHGFQVKLPESPESQLALKKTKHFLAQYLGKAATCVFEELVKARQHPCRETSCADSDLTKQLR